MGSSVSSHRNNQLPDVMLKKKKDSSRRLLRLSVRKHPCEMPLSKESRTDREHSPDQLRPDSSIDAESNAFRLDEKNVYDFIWQYMEDFTEIAQNTSSKAWTRFWERNHTKDYIYIRPSGNPLDMKGYMEMFESGDIQEFSDTMVAVESIKLFADGEVAVMVFKSEQIFEFRGTLEEDLVTWTVVLVADQCAQRPRITNIHRATGKQVGQVFVGNKESQR